MARRGILALATLLAAASSAAAELGTLFHTPEERAALDRLRRGEPTEPPPAEAQARPPVVTGYVRRSDGRHTVWVDGTPLATRKDPRTFDPRTLPQREPAGTADKGQAASPGEAQSRPAPAPPKS